MPTLPNIDPTYLLIGGIVFLVLVALFFFIRYNRSRSPAAVAQVAQNGLAINVKYNQPYKKGRTVFGDVVPFGKVWRTGANAATIITLDRNMYVADQPINKGSYSLYTIPSETEWMLIFNGKTGQWGRSYDQTTDVLRITVPVRLHTPGAEQFYISFEPRPDGTAMLLTWDQTQVVVPFRKR